MPNEPSITYTATITNTDGTTTTFNFPSIPYLAVKAVGDWELEVKVVPFNDRDSDKQWFDSNTDIMEDAFSTPLAIYQHGVKQGAKELQEKPIVVGKTVPGSLEKRGDGWYLRLILNKAVKVAKDIMEAARKGLVAVSSDSISHLARLEVGGKMIQYEKNREGRIAVWPLAGFSLWEMGNGNFRPASRATFALPTFKAMYREADTPFPDVVADTGGGTSEAATVAANRARIATIKEQSKQLISKANKLLGE